MNSSEFAPVDNCDDLQSCNHTELYQLCRRAGVNVIPTMDKGALIAALEGILEVSDVNPIDEWRYGIMQFLLEHWRRASSQLFCPAKSGDPDACKQCVDAQVVHCITTNPRIEPGVLRHITKRREAR